MADLPFPKSLPDFQKLFPDDAACATYQERIHRRVPVTRARYDEACPRPGSLGIHSDSYGDDGDGPCRFCGEAPRSQEPHEEKFFASLPTGTVLELRTPAEPTKSPASVCYTSVTIRR